ncbi:MAG: 4-hydroxyphenylpyruvate dioxygenase [Ectothiorhodospiraceae bacterium]|nr:4-hydroxyphenylpyruvate dioxygenase [Ectothiorhodospiraceae bacterium]
MNGRKPQQSLWENPIGTDGFEFVEYAAPEPEELEALFLRMGFSKVARHRSKQVSLFRQGGINFILNAEPGSQGMSFASAHGPCANAMAFRVRDANVAMKTLVSRGAKPVQAKAGPMELNIPAIEGIGGALLYLVDRYGERSIYDVDFEPIPGADMRPAGHGLTYIDHLTHNVVRGGMDRWARFYQELFNFREIRYFDIEGKLTGLTSRAMTSPDGKIRIPINESADDKSQIEEFIREYKGEGIQHIALGTDDIYTTVDRLRAAGVALLDTPDTYYDKVNERIPGHGEDLHRLRERRILVDGAPTEGQGLLLQIFTETVIGPIFFEIIQRKGNEGFGEGNFKALFESIEEDQIRRGVLSSG